MDQTRLSVTDYAVLGVLADGPSHGFAISSQLGAGGAVGRVFTVRRPLTYRSLDRLIREGLAEPIHTEPSTAGPQRTIHRITPEGSRRLQSWLFEPVEHLRDLRLQFQLKMTLLRRAGRSPLPLIRAQRQVLDPTIRALDVPTSGEADHLDLWRHHIALAAAAYLDDLERRYNEGI